MSRQLLTVVLTFFAVAVAAQQTGNPSSENQTHSMPQRIRVSGGVIVGRKRQKARRIAIGLGRALKSPNVPPQVTGVSLTS
jgi:hypothetical protein